MINISELLLTFFYSGKAKKAPGTFGSAAALMFWFCLNWIFFKTEVSLLNQNIFWGFFLFSIFFYGCFAIKNYAKKVGEIDHSSIVLDEVVGQILPLQITFNLIVTDYFFKNDLIAKHLLFCFILFRLLDIKKPLLIGWCDRNLKNGFGVMFDDLLCGIFTTLLGYFFFK